MLKYVMTVGMNGEKFVVERCKRTFHLAAILERHFER